MRTTAHTLVLVAILFATANACGRVYLERTGTLNFSSESVDEDCEWVISPVGISDSKLTFRVTQLTTQLQVYVYEPTNPSARVSASSILSQTYVAKKGAFAVKALTIPGESGFGRRYLRLNVEWNAVKQTACEAATTLTEQSGQFSFTLDVTSRCNMDCLWKIVPSVTGMNHQINLTVTIDGGSNYISNYNGAITMKLLNGASAKAPQLMRWNPNPYIYRTSTVYSTLSKAATLTLESSDWENCKRNDTTWNSTTSGSTTGSTTGYNYNHNGGNPFSTLDDSKLVQITVSYKTVPCGDYCEVEATHSQLSLDMPSDLNDDYAGESAIIYYTAQNAAWNYAMHFVQNLTKVDQRNYLDLKSATVHAFYMAQKLDTALKLPGGRKVKARMHSDSVWVSYGN